MQTGKAPTAAYGSEFDPIFSHWPAPLGLHAVNPLHLYTCMNPTKLSVDFSETL